MPKKTSEQDEIVKAILDGKNTAIDVLSKRIVDLEKGKSDLIIFLQKLADERGCQDLILEDTGYDFIGDNIDDGFIFGIKQGRIDLAREILEKFFQKA
jgi:hypothetical protein